jgi:hypothetical protein
MTHHAYIPDLTQSDFILIGYQKTNLSGEWIDRDEKLFSGVRAVFAGNPGGLLVSIFAENTLNEHFHSTYLLLLLGNHMSRL